MEWGELLPVALVVLVLMIGWIFVIHGKVSKMEAEIDHLKENAKSHVADLTRISKIEGVIDMIMKEPDVFVARGKLVRDNDRILVQLLKETGGELDVNSDTISIK
ncbi:hypothetical protein McpSp1_09200 [Methanocorpusculaceae archaeon Sp1]|nr:hypothetical protein [Methanocorpusculaceae archaeon Sp1]